MKKLHISELVKLPSVTQGDIGDVMNVTQGAVWQMIKAERPIYFIFNSMGELVEYQEVKTKKPVNILLKVPELANASKANNASKP